MNATYPNTASSVGGYTCFQCGGYVSNGLTHSCPTSFRWVNPPPPPAPAAMERIADALERIATQLEGGAET